MSVDPVTGDANVSFSDTRHDTTGARFMTDIYFTQNAGLVSFGGVSHPFWTDSRNQLDPFAGCRNGLAMEEVFTATVTKKR